MAELRLQISDQFVRKLQERLGEDMRVTDIARDALTLFNWAVEERSKGRLILSSDKDGEKTIRLAMPSLENVKIDTPS
jgi:hypothetical protein